MLCLRETVGSNASFHCKDGRGYSSDIGKAEIYTLEEAQRDWERGREIDLPVSADCVDALSEWHVDCQLIPSESDFTSKSGYVAFVKGRWDGNDVYWLTRTAPKTNFDLAVKFDEPDHSIEREVVWVPFDLANSVKRKTFKISLLDKRKMIQAAGLRKPEWLKKYERRRDSGKTRMNCPCCGRINWQFNPYDFESCSNVSCKNN